MENEILEKETWSKEEVDSIKAEMEDKYIRLYAEFENYKKRIFKEKEDIRNSTKINTLSSILDMNNDLSIAYKQIKDTEGIDLIISKLEKFLKSQGIEEIQTTTYDPDVHEVISIMETGEEKIVDIVSKGYTLNGNIIRYPKIILSK
jgi:molecular chaperone GrpE